MLIHPQSSQTLMFTPKAPVLQFMIYARDLYQTPGFGDTTNFAAIKKHYHIDCCPSNEFAIVPNGPDGSLWLTPHGREKLSGK